MSGNNKIKLTDKQIKHLDRVVKNRRFAEESLVRAKEEETAILELICDAHGISASGGIRYEEGFLILSENKKK